MLGMDSVKTSDDQAIIRYLLGDLAESETEKIEGRYFGDQAFFDQVAALEDLLIREYLDHLLSVTDVELFERKYLRVPELQEKVALARGLRAVAVAQRTRGYRPSRHKWLALLVSRGRARFRGHRPGALHSIMADRP